MWGEPVPIGSLNISEAQKRYTSPTDVIVDAPIGKTLFDDCEWRNFMSRRYFYIILTYTASKRRMTKNGLVCILTSVVSK